MDQLVIDDVEEVPDTPDRTMQLFNRPPRRYSNSKHSGQSSQNRHTGGVKKEIITLETHSEQEKLCTEQTKSQLITNVIGTTRLLSHCPSRTSSSGHSGHLDCHAKSSAFEVHGSPSKISFLHGRNNESAPNHYGRHYISGQLRKKEDQVLNPEASSCTGGLVVNSTKSTLVEGFNKGAVSSCESSDLRDMENLSVTTKNGRGVKLIGDKNKVTVPINHGERTNVAHDVRYNGMKAGYASVTTSLPRVTGKRRLVRNGCISPHNIAKAKQPIGTDQNCPLTVERDCTRFPATSSSSKNVFNVIDLVSEEHTSCSSKGKGVTVYPSISSEPKAKSANTSHSNMVVIDDEIDTTASASQDTLRSFEEPGGWRTTRSRSQNRFLQREKESNENVRNNPMCKDLPSSRHAFAQSSQIVQSIGQQSGCVDDHHSVVNSLGKRQKQGSTSSNYGECSTSTFSDGITCTGSSRNVSNLRSGWYQNRQRKDFLAPVLETCHSSPQIRSDSSQASACKKDEDARVRQLEADEMLARELQEQLYNETPIFGVTEIDEHLAMDLQQDGAHHSFSGETNTIITRGRSATISQRRSQVQSSASISRRASFARASTSNRSVRSGTRFPRQSRSLASARHTSSIFAPSVNIETRIEMLEALEAFSNMEVAGRLLHARQDFNENDYEMLLALDEDNHHHAGASINQINGLPLSVVQVENLEEACAVCLETLIIGDTIRLLPCVHKFHKDCIDPWLLRRTLCPICKISIT
ncbi:unnamed protein product [Cuscuta epithymum]|uniref:RING-type domain-containing protein n=1 Tax=Cuscuta epithymum TaxID=186058 RepID=A0AAV0D5F6_9ASTE|nr:unnamed protein product [Cuscuta epithymum]